MHDRDIDNRTRSEEFAGRPSTPRTNRNLGESVITKRIDGDRKAGAQGARGWSKTNGPP